MKKIYSLVFLFVFAVSFMKSQSTFTYTGKPMYKIDIKRGGVFIGSIKVELFPTIAPLHVRNFDSLVSVQFYDSTAFHRVIPGFMIQGGDPNSRHGATSTWGFGQPGQPTVNAEFSVSRHVRGILSAARSNNINSATSQFFICVAAYPSLNGQYTVYGRVIGGMNYADTTVLAPRNTTSNLPNVKHEMFITAIGSNDTIPNKPIPNTPANNTGTIDVAAQQLMKWNNVPGAIIYTLEVASDSLFANVVKTVEVGTNMTYINNTFTQDSIYYWHVKANNGGHYSEWSDVWNFGKAAADIANTTGLSSQQLNKKTLVFPNPNHGKYTMTNLEQGSRVEVYDIRGKLVYETTVKENTAIIDLENKAKGIYTYKIHSSEKGSMEGKVIVE